MRIGVFHVSSGAHLCIVQVLRLGGVNAISRDVVKGEAFHGVGVVGVAAWWDGRQRGRRRGRDVCDVGVLVLRGVVRVHVLRGSGRTPGAWLSAGLVRVVVLEACGLGCTATTLPEAETQQKCEQCSGKC